MLIRIGQRPDHGFDEPLGLLSDCHRRIEHFLHVLVVMAEQPPAGPLTPVQRTALETAITYFATAAPTHTADEEESLFPRLRASSDPDAARAVDLLMRLEQDHQRADEHHAAVDALVRGWLSRGSLDRGEIHVLREHLAALQAIYQPHIGVEDRELFPAASRLLTDGELREIGREMAARRPAAARP